MKSATFGLAAALLLGLANAGLANDLAATEQFSGTMIGFQPQQAYANLTLRVSGPNEFHASASFPGGAPFLELSRFGVVADGTYSYHLTATNGESVAASTRDEGRPKSTAANYQYRGLSKSGSFTVKGGAIIGFGASAAKSKRDGGR